MDIGRIQSLLRQAQESAGQLKSKSSSADDFSAVLEQVSNRQKEASKAAESLLVKGEGDLHDVQIQLAKADLTFRLLLEVRNKLTEAYQEVSRLNV
jgi:flagellar hook-basal body complex protein FliE